MNDMISFLKEIFMIKESDAKVGLSQFKATSIVEKQPKKEVKQNAEVKLSDLMRGA